MNVLRKCRIHIDLLPKFEINDLNSQGIYMIDKHSHLSGGHVVVRIRCRHQVNRITRKAQCPVKCVEIVEGAKRSQV
jgi:hypothetical protein